MKRSLSLRSRQCGCTSPPVLDKNSPEKCSPEASPLLTPSTTPSCESLTPHGTSEITSEITSSDPLVCDAESIEDGLEEFWTEASAHCQLADASSTKQLKQATLFSFMGAQPSGKGRANGTSRRPGEIFKQTQTLDNKPASAKKFDSAKTKKSPRNCPFYKRMPGTAFTVDAFSYGSIPGCSAYFLTHFHADHYVGLRKNFQHSIYCSEVTGNLVQQQLKVSAEYVKTFPLNEPFTLDKVEVTFLEANHCPGSVLILFRLKSGQNYLHTGDFRFSTAMLHVPPLASGLTIHQLYLDTTYCDPRYDFPPQERVVAFAVDKCLATLHSCPNTLIVCGTYTIGKEKVFAAIADVLGVKICVTKEKKAVLDCLKNPSLSESLVTDYSQSCLHIVPMAKLNLKNLVEYHSKWNDKYSQLLAFKPTGWSHSGKTANIASIQPQSSGAVSIYGIPYSEHSSYDELRRCVQALRPLKVIPTVNNSSAHKRTEMQRTFQQWLSRSAKDKAPVQTKLKNVKL